MAKFSGIVASLLLSASPALGQQLAQADINQLSIEQLANIEITSVSKAAQPLSGAPAAVYVIGHDDIIRSGANSVPEMLRLAPNLEVMQTSPSNYQITARGFNGNTADQNFPDKLLVLIDGRSVYSPLFSGVYWDMQDVLPEDVERIEVISGPGGTLWGANAVNGVVNIVTRKSSDTQGGFLDVGAGDRESSAAIQYGGALGDNATYRVYAKDFYDRAFDSSPGISAHDGWSKPQGGFRLDWTPDSDSVTLEGDAYRGAEAMLGDPNQDIVGRNLTLNWRRPLAEESNIQLLAYYDDAERTAINGGGFAINTYDLELQHNFPLANWNNLIWGIGDRSDQYRITDRIGAANSLLFVPTGRILNLADVFAEDHILFGHGIELTLGLKLENDPYSGVTPMPDGRLSWNINQYNMVWGAISRSVRSPTPFDVDVVEKAGSTTFVTGNPNFLPEQVTAYELGYRAQLSQAWSASVSGYQNVYTDLKDIEPNPATFLPLQWANTMEGSVHGIEVWGLYQPFDWWRLSTGFNIQHEDLKFLPGASGLLGIAQAGDDPHHQASLRSTMNVLKDVVVEADFRDVGALPDPKVPEYAELNARVGWHVSETLDLSLSGFNLLHGHHVEFAPGDEIPRNFFVEAKWRF